jgi:hypothetical protein
MIRALPLLTPAARCDCRSCPLYRDNPRAIQPICSGCNTDCAYCGCARSGGGTRCGQCPIRCGSRVDIAAWLTDVGGTLAFDDLDDLRRVELPAGLPALVPQVRGPAGKLDRELSWPAYAIGLRRIFSPKTATLYPSFLERSAREALGLRHGQLAVLVGYGDDPLIEAFWTRRRFVVPAIARQDWDLVLAPNFSMYGNQPRAEHLLNFRRNLLIASELAAAGIPAVANVYWFRPEDLERYAVAWEASPPPAIAVNLQTCRTDADWHDLALPGLAFLAAALPPSVRVIVTGPSRAGRIRQLRALLGGRLHLVTQNPIQYAEHGAVMTSRGRVNRRARLEDLFAANVRHYAGLLGGGGAPDGQR